MGVWISAAASTDTTITAATTIIYSIGVTIDITVSGSY